MAIAPQNSIAPPEPMLDPTAWGFAGLDIPQLAAAGYFRAIAYWLNEPLVSQQVYAQVLADEVPGRLRILVEFERVPQPQRLVRFVCDRLYRLNSDVIEGVHLIARPLGTDKTNWEQRVRIPTAAQRQQKQRQQIPQQIPQAAPAAVQPAIPQPADAQVTDTQAATGSAIPQDRAPQLVHESSRSQAARQVVRSQFKFFRAAFISGAAAAAFLFGGLTELVLAGRLTAPVATSADTALPWYGESADDDFPEGSEATTVAFRSASRFTGRTVEAALETVAVIPHDQVAQPADPTITLLFGGELSLKDFVFEEADSLDQLFSGVSLYQQADVAMVGLAEPLAYASTSLQEDFYHRTRPQAVQTLKAGGIDIVSLASEGTLAYGTQGLSETLETLDQQNIYRVGAGLNQQEAHRPEILEVKGQRIAYLGYNPEALSGAEANKAGVALTSSEDQRYIIEDIKAIRPQVDWIVVNYRWGDPLEAPEEGLPEADTASSETSQANLPTSSVPADWQKALAREAVDAGADLVVGYHPNQIQGAEIYRDRAIAYSLGDFVFSSAPLADHDTAALKVSLRNHQMKVEFLPVTIQDSHLQMATGEHGAAILQTIRDASKSFDQPMHFPAVLEAKPTPVPTAPQKLNESASSDEAGFNGDGVTDETLPPETYLPETYSPESEVNTVEPDDGWPPVEVGKPPKSPQAESVPAENLEAYENYEDPAPNPVLPEPKALFDETSSDEPVRRNPRSSEPAPTVTEETDAFIDQPVSAPWQDEKLLEDWGEKQTEPWRELPPTIEAPAQPEGPIEAEEPVNNRRSDAGSELESSGLYLEASEETSETAAAADYAAEEPTNQPALVPADDAASESEVIAPYAEPLVGPLSVLPAVDALPAVDEPVPADSEPVSAE